MIKKLFNEAVSLAIAPFYAPYDIYKIGRYLQKSGDQRHVNLHYASSASLTVSAAFSIAILPVFPVIGLAIYAFNAVVLRYGHNMVKKYSSFEGLKPETEETKNHMDTKRPWMA